MIANPNINCDLGEGNPRDEDFMKLISSCNIACGGHFGNEKTIRTTIQLAKKYKVRIGAHPSYPDQENFGRVSLNIEKVDLVRSIKEQVKLLQNICEEENAILNHVKLHGALYNDVWENPNLSSTVIEALKELKTDFRVYAPYNSVFANLASKHFEIVHEGFIDRKYTDQGRLASRKEEGAVLTSNQECWKQFHALVTDGNCISIAGNEINIKADTYCIHSDSEGALKNLKFIYKCLQDA